MRRWGDEAPDSGSRAVPVERWGPWGARQEQDSVVVEEPLEIRLNDAPLAVTMRTPGDDDALAAGFLATEGIVRCTDEIWDITRCADPSHPDALNIVTVYVSPDLVPESAETGHQRYATSSCGLCGRAAIDSIRRAAPLIADSTALSQELILSLPGRLREAQRVFECTGGLHAAGLFSSDGELLHVAEDVGRHNAVDKVIGRALLHGPWPLEETILMVSGRAGFEIVQKALMARIPAVCSVSAPSSLAAELASEMGMTLIGFLRGETMNVYAGPERVRE